METLVMSAKTVEEAIELALRQLDAEREEVEIDVVSRGKTGILGIGSEPATVRVTRLETPNETIKVAKEVLDALLSRMNVSALATLKSAYDEESGGPVFDIQGEDSGLLIGRRGETLRSLQFLANFLVSQRLQDRVRIVVDVEGYRERRYRTLRTLALRTAERVAATRHPITLEPMPPNERRIVHLALTDNDQVIAESSGEGEGRRITIMLK